MKITTIHPSFYCKSMIYDYHIKLFIVPHIRIRLYQNNQNPTKVKLQNPYSIDVVIHDECCVKIKAQDIERLDVSAIEVVSKEIEFKVLIIPCVAVSLILDIIVKLRSHGQLAG